MPTLMLIDGNSLTYRAFHALPTDLATASGQVTNAVFGFTSMLLNLVRDHQPDLIGVTFDRPGADVPPRAGRHVQGQPRVGAGHPPPADGPRPPGRRHAAAPDGGGVGLRGRRRDRHARHPGPRRGHPTRSWSPATATPTSWSRTRTSRCSTTSAGVSDYALYDEAGILERTGVRPDQYVFYAALRRRSVRQPAGRAGSGGEDGGQARHQLRRPRRDLRPHRGSDPEAPSEPRGERATGPPERRDDGPGARRRPRRPARRPRAGRLRLRGAARAVQLPRVRIAGAPAGRGVR